MLKNKYGSIEEFYTAIKTEKIDEAKLSIVLDNDKTMFDYAGESIGVGGTGGYQDVLDVYQLLFPKAEVDWV